MRTRREFLETCGRAATLALGAAAGAGGVSSALARASAPLADEETSSDGAKPRYGLVTYLWGKDWDLDTLLRHCDRSKVLGVELRTTHAHGVEPSLDEAARRKVRERFADSLVELVGLGSNERFDHIDPDALAKAIEDTKKFIRLSHDVGGSGVKVKPNDLHDSVPHETTIAQIGKALLELGRYAEGYGQEVRLEVHGSCASLPTMRAIADHAKHPSVAICWNSNAKDLEGEGLEHNFRLVRERFGRTLHVRRLDKEGYPWPRLIELLVETEWDGWVLLEDSKLPENPVAELTAQRELFEEILARAG